MKSTLSSLRGVNILGKEQQKSIKGGAGGCAVYIPAGTSINPGTNWTTTGGTITPAGTTYYGVTKTMAGNLTSNGGKWCCDSCGSASWYNPSVTTPVDIDFGKIDTGGDFGPPSSIGG